MKCRTGELLYSDGDKWETKCGICECSIEVCEGEACSENYLQCYGIKYNAISECVSKEEDDVFCYESDDCDVCHYKDSTYDLGETVIDEARTCEIGTCNGCIGGVSFELKNCRA